MDLLISKHREGFTPGYTPVTVANQGGDFTGFDQRIDLTRTDRTFFFKVGYAWVL